MRKVTFSITKKQEKLLVRQFAAAGFTSYFIENTGTTNLLHVFTETAELPGALNEYNPESIEDADCSNWRNSWAATFTGHELTEDIYVTASGATEPGKEYMHLISIDPRDSFGDGHHPTTRLCAGLLRDYVSQQANPEKLAMIDVGTGSGMLAIVAFITGIRNIELFDIDETSVRMAERNLELNRIYGLKPFVGDVYTLIFNKKYDIITANLLTGLLEDNISSLADALENDGVMIISGISAKWTRLAMSLFKRNNLIILKHKRLEGWNGFMLHKAE